MQAKVGSEKVKAEVVQKEVSGASVGYGIFFILMSAFLALILVLGKAMPAWSVVMGVVVIFCLALMAAAALPARK